MLHIGTSGYSYQDWVGPVYPPDAKARDFLALYAERFDFVELNFSFYRQPEAAAVERLRTRAPPGFRFAAKVHRSLTHDAGTDIPSAARAFREGVRPLSESAQLVAALLQFPWSFHYTPDSRRRLDGACRALEGLPLAVEFRNREWYRDSVYAELGRRAIALTSVDLPSLPELPPADLFVTAPLGYLRFHGRNATTWWTGDNASRYDYTYSAAELDTWAARVLDALKSVSVMVIAFNNHFRGQAVANALELRDRLLSAPALPIPAPPAAGV